MMEDAELSAMKTVYEALKDLDEDARQRTLAWAAGRLEVNAPVEKGGASGAAGANEDTSDFSDVAELIDAAQPARGPEHALVVAYWIQIIEKKEGWTGNEVNSQLRNMGHGAANITTTLDRLIKRKPSLVMQTAREGKGTNAKKTYKLTSVGIRAVQSMISKGSRNSDL
jgi:hypothetical protein